MKMIDMLRWPLTVIVSLALVILAVVVFGGDQLGIDPETVAMVRTRAQGIAAGVGALLLPLAVRDRDGDGWPDWIQWVMARMLADADRAPDSGSDPPGGPGAGSGGAAVMLLAVMLQPLLGACGASEWDVHAAAADISHETAITGRAVVLGERRRVLLATGQAAEDVAVAVTEAAAAWDAANRGLIEAVNVFATAANAYAEGAFAALRGEADSLDALRTLARRVGEAWNAVAAILESTAVSEQVPRIPDWLLRFLEGDATAQPTAGGVA